MQAGEGGFANDIELVDVGARPFITDNSAAGIMGSRHHGDGFAGNVDPEAQTLFVNGREVLFDEVGRLMADIQEQVVCTQALHLMVNGPGNNVPGREFRPFIKPVHKSTAIRQPEHATFAPNRLGNQEGLGVRVVQAGGVELVELHVGNTAPRPPGHGNSVSRSAVRIGGIAIRLGGAAGSDDGEPGSKQFHMIVFEIQDVGADATVAGKCKLAVGNQIHSHPAGFQVNIRPGLGLARQGGGNRVAGGIGGVDNPAMAMATFSGQVVVLSVILPGELHAGVDQPLDAFLAVFHGKADRVFVAQTAARVEGVLYVILYGIGIVQNRSDASLGPEGGARADIGFADDANPQVLRKIQRNGKAGSAAADDQNIVFVGLWH